VPNCSTKRPWQVKRPGKRKMIKTNFEQHGVGAFVHLPFLGANLGAVGSFYLLGNIQSGKSQKKF
jgi:hypothetical protein